MTGDEWLIPAGEARELTPDELREAVQGDPEMTLVTDYLLGALSDDEAAALEARLERDRDFRARVSPVLGAWQAFSGMGEAALPEERVARAWQRVRAGGAFPPQEGLTEEPAPARGAIDPALRRARRWQLAAALLVVVGLPLAGVAGGHVARRMDGARVSWREASGREWESVHVGDGSWVMLAPGGRLTWGDAPSANGARELLLDGGARFRLAPLTSGHYVVLTPSARLLVTGTEFEVELRDPATTRVSVRSGRVIVEARGPRPGAGIELRAGETAEVSWNDGARRVR